MWDIKSTINQPNVLIFLGTVGLTLSACSADESGMDTDSALLLDADAAVTENSAIHDSAVPVDSSAPESMISDSAANDSAVDAIIDSAVPVDSSAPESMTSDSAANDSAVDAIIPPKFPEVDADDDSYVKTELNCDDRCKSEGFVFGYCRFGYSESKTELDCSEYKEYELFGIENQVCVGQTNDCKGFVEGLKPNMYYISTCSCVPECIPDEQPLNNVDPSYCCSKEAYEVATACWFDPETGKSGCSYTTFCGKNEY